MSDRSHSQELHGNVSEFFPDYGSLERSGIGSQNEKKSLLAKLAAGAATAAAVAMVVLPYIVCHMLFVGQTTASISTRLMNIPPEAEAYYLVSEYPGLSNQQLLAELDRDPDLGTPIPEDGNITLEGLDSRTRYRLVFFTRGGEEGEELKILPGKYSFTTDRTPQILHQEELPQPEPQLPESPVQPESTVPEPAETTAPTEETTEPTETTVPTEAATEPAETTEPTRPPAPKPKPKPKPTPQPEPKPEPPATEPPTEPPYVAPVVSAGAPTVAFTEKADGTASFAPEFPFSLENGQPSRAEVVLVHTLADGTTVTDAPVPATFTQTGTNVVVTPGTTAVPLGEGIRIEPTLYYQDSKGVETGLPGTAYEAAPAGIAGDTAVNLRYDHLGDRISYAVNLTNIRNPGTKQPADSSLVIESMELTYLGSGGVALTAPQTVPIGEEVTGQTYSKSGEVYPIPVEAYDAKGIQVKVNAVWKAGGQNALRSGSGAVNGIANAYVMPDTPVLQSGTAVPGTSRTQVVASFTYAIQDGTPLKVSIQATGGSDPANVVEGVPVQDTTDPARYTLTMPYEVGPGETVNFMGTLHYDDHGVEKTCPSSLSVSPANLANVSGSLNLSRDFGDFAKYKLSLSGFTNAYYGDDSGLALDSVDLVFEPVGGGTPVTVSGGYASDIFIGGNTMPEKNGTADLSSVPYGDYKVHAIIQGRWMLKNTKVQDIPTSGRVDCGSIITLPLTN